MDLYLDQVVNYLEKYLGQYTANTEDKIITKTMINNYVKNELIEAPIKKQYSKVQLAKLFVICVLKQVYSMQDIKKLISMALEFAGIEASYNQFCNLFEEALLCTYTRKDFIDKNSSSDNMYLLKSVLLSCSYKIYVQNTTKK